MNTLSRNTSSTLNGRLAGYEPLDQKVAAAEPRGRSWRALSKRKEVHVIWGRGEVRTRHRQIFLKSYTFVTSSSKDVVVGSGRSRSTERLKKVAVKVRTAAVSVVGSLRSSCSAPSAVFASSPARKAGS